ncbi:MAG: DUF2934 domain-containing protein [Planctomycetota bacterium]
MPVTRTKRTVTKKNTKPRTAVAVDHEELVRMRAFEIYQTRVRTQVPGDHVSDWLQAEKEAKSLAAPLRT